jgi:hypothetical protein
MVETTETTAEQLYEYDKVEYLFGSMLLDPRVQHYFGADDRIASNPDTNPITINDAVHPLRIRGERTDAGEHPPAWLRLSLASQPCSWPNWNAPSSQILI